MNVSIYINNKNIILINIHYCSKVWGQEDKKIEKLSSEIQSLFKVTVFYFNILKKKSCFSIITAVFTVT